MPLGEADTRAKLIDPALHSLSDIRDLDGRVAYDTREYTNEAGIENSAARVLPCGTVVVSRTASVGFVTVMGREMATSQDLSIGYAAPSWRRASPHSSLGWPGSICAHFCLPSIEEQRRVTPMLTGQLGYVEKMQEAAEEQLEAMTRLSMSLLRQAYSRAL